MKTFIAIISVIALSFFTITPLLKDGFFEFHDNTQVVRVYEMGKMLSEKAFPVRWVPDLGYGYGYPIFNFYAPFPYYIGGIFNLMGFDALIATKIMFVIGALVAPITMYFLLRKYYGETAGIVGGVVFAYFPYHAVNIYVRGAVGEFFAYAFLPLVLIGIAGILQAKKRINALMPFLALAFGVFLVAISHNLTFFMLLILLMPLLMGGFFLATNRGIFLAMSIGGIAAGILFASFYILPAFAEMEYTNVSSQIGGGADFPDHFVCVGQFWDSMWGYGGSVKGCIDGMSFKLGKVNVLLTVISLGFFAHAIYRRKFKFGEKIATISLLGLVVSIFMATSASQIIWETFPLIEYVQYPWRFINFVALFATVVIGYGIYAVSKKLDKRIFYVIIGGILIGILFSNAKLFNPQQQLEKKVADYLSKEYILFTVSKISDEYLPSGFAKPQSVFELPEKDVEIYKTEGSVNFGKIKSNYYAIEYHLNNDGVIHINKAYYPSWDARINGSKVPIVPTSDGMNVSVKGGEGVLEVRMKHTPIQLVGNAITVLSFSGLAAVIIILSKRKN